jgi:pimeloyl-ACP methyl ester carboxylesterase
MAPPTPGLGRISAWLYTPKQEVEYPATSRRRYRAVIARAASGHGQGCCIPGRSIFKRSDRDARRGSTGAETRGRQASPLGGTSNAIYRRATQHRVGPSRSATLTWITRSMGSARLSSSYMADSPAAPASVRRSRTLSRSPPGQFSTNHAWQRRPRAPERRRRWHTGCRPDPGDVRRLLADHTVRARRRGGPAAHTDRSRRRARICAIRGRVSWIARASPPTRVLDGDHDEFIPDDISAALYRAIPNAELAIVPGNGHVGPTQPDRAGVFAGLITDFVPRHRGA